MRLEASITSILDRRSRAWLADRSKQDMLHAAQLHKSHRDGRGTRQNLHPTFMLVLVGVGGEEHIWEELLEAVPRVAWPVFYVRPDRLIQLHQKVLRRSAELLDHFIPLVDVCSADVKERERARRSDTVTSLTSI